MHARARTPPWPALTHCADLLAMLPALCVAQGPAWRRPISAPLIVWCSNFIEGGDEDAVDDVTWRRLSACVRGAVHFTSDVQIDEMYNPTGRYYTKEIDGYTDYCRDLEFAPPSWRPAELVELCYRTISWDFQNASSSWSQFYDQ